MSILGARYVYRGLSWVNLLAGISETGARYVNRGPLWVKLWAGISETGARYVCRGFLAGHPAGHDVCLAFSPLCPSLDPFLDPIPSHPPSLTRPHCSSSPVRLRRSARTLSHFPPTSVRLPLPLRRGSLRHLEDSESKDESSSAEMGNGTGAGVPRPRVPFKDMFEVVCAHMDTELATLLLYSLLHGSRLFVEYVTKVTPPLLLCTPNALLPADGITRKVPWRSRAEAPACLSRVTLALRYQACI